MIQMVWNSIFLLAELPGFRVVVDMVVSFLIQRKEIIFLFNSASEWSEAFFGTLLLLQSFWPLGKAILPGTVQVHGISEGPWRRLPVQSWWWGQLYLCGAEWAGRGLYQRKGNLFTLHVSDQSNELWGTYRHVLLPGTEVMKLVYLCCHVCLFRKEGYSCSRWSTQGTVL